MTRAKLGQHFLINKTKLSEIAGALDLGPNDAVIEIGPGHGELTKEIISKFQGLKAENFKIIAVEKDKKLAERLKKSEEIKKSGDSVEIIQGDALKVLKSLISNLKSDYKIAGNIPYYITGYLFRVLGGLERKPKLIVLLIQKEVAERVCSGPKKMNLLAASVQFWAKPEIVRYVSRKDFWPAPEVDSAIISLLPTREYKEENEEVRENYYKFIRILFKQPRKTILNNLKPITGDSELTAEKIKLAGVEQRARPQDLSIEQIIKLSELF